MVGSEARKASKSARNECWHMDMFEKCSDGKGMCVSEMADHRGSPWPVSSSSWLGV